MELRDLEYFLVVAEQRHLGRASEALGLSATALSKSLRRLEATMRAKLVARTPKGVELTAEGRALLARVHELRLSLDDVTREVADVARGQVGNLTIATSPSPIATMILGEAIRRFVESTRKVTVAIRVGQTHVTLPALRNGDVDMGISILPLKPHEDLVHRPLVEDDIVVIGAARHPLAARKTVTFPDLRAQNWALAPDDSILRRRFDQLFESHGFSPPNATLQINSAPMILQLVAESDSLCYLSRWWLRDRAFSGRLAEIPAREMITRRHTGLSYRKNAYLSPAARRFIEVLQATAEEISTEVT